MIDGWMKEMQGRLGLAPIVSNRALFHFGETRRKWEAVSSPVDTVGLKLNG